MSTHSRSIRAMSILEAVARANRPLRIADLVDICELPKATVHRICALLCEQGYLRPELSGKGLEPGHRLKELSQAVLSSSAARNARHAVLESVARQVGETCNLAVPDGLYMAYWDRVETEWPLKVQLPISTRVPLHCTAGGKLYLSSLPQVQRSRLLDRLELERRTPNTITERSKLEAALDTIAATGIGTDNEEFIEGMVAVSVGVTDGSGRLFATLAVHGPTLRLSIEQAKSHVPLLKAAAAEIGADAARDAELPVPEARTGARG